MEIIGNIGERIKNIRSSLGLSQADFARKIHVTQTTISDWESGKYTPPAKNLHIISDIFPVHLDWLFTGTGQMMTKLLPLRSFGVYEDDQGEINGNIGERIKALREALGFSQARFAADVLVSQTTISDWESGKYIPPIKNLHFITTIHPVNAEWLFTGTGNMFTEIPYQDSPQVRKHDRKGKQTNRLDMQKNNLLRSKATLKKVYSLAEARTSKELTDNKPIDIIAVPSDFSRPSIVPVKVDGMSMYPTIWPNAILGIDTSDKQIVSGEIYALWMPHEGAIIKRLFISFDKVIIKSDNSSFPTFEIPLSEINTGAYGDNFILGRVEWIIQSIRR